MDSFLFVLSTFYLFTKRPFNTDHDSADQPSTSSRTTVQTSSIGVISTSFHPIFITVLQSKPSIQQTLPCFFNSILSHHHWTHHLDCARRSSQSLEHVPDGWPNRQSICNHLRHSPLPGAMCHPNSSTCVTALLFVGSKVYSRSKL